MGRAKGKQQNANSKLKSQAQALGQPSRKVSGEASEAAFIARACSLNFKVAKPWGDSGPFDVLVGVGRGFWRVQVKFTSFLRIGKYTVRAGGHNGTYSKAQIDFIAAHVMPMDVWYIVPVEVFAGKARLHFNPRGGSRAMYEKYREAWCLLTCEETGRGKNDVPRECRCEELPVRCAGCPLRKACPPSLRKEEQGRARLPVVPKRRC